MKEYFGIKNVSTFLCIEKFFDTAEHAQAYITNVLGLGKGWEIVKLPREQRYFDLHK